MRFQTRLFMIWGLVVLLLWAGTWWPVRHAIDASFSQLAADEFSATRRDLHAQEAERVRSMRQAAAMLMNIPELRALIAEHNFEVSSENLASLQERLDNLAGIVRVDFVCVLDSRGNVIAQNSGSPWKTLAELNDYLARSPQGNAMVRRVFQGAAGSAKAVSPDAFGKWSYQGRLLQAVGVPLVFNSDADSAPAADGGLIMAAPVTDDIARGLAQSHKCEVSFLSGGSVAACSLPAQARTELTAAARTLDSPAQSTFELALNGVSYRSSIDAMIDPCSNQPVGAMLIQSDLKDAKAARKRVSTWLISSMIGGLLAAALASFFVSGAITRPVRELARGVKRVAECDLDVQIRVSGRDELGQLAGTFNDMVRQLRVRRELERAVEEAKATTKAKSQFLATMSHEIRTPLNGVIGMAELLLRSNLSDQQRRYAGMVKSSAEVLTTLINDILDFSKMEAGKLELESVDFNLHELTEDVVELLAIKAMSKGLEVACDLHPDVPATFRGDPTRLRQVIVNLVNNAIKFTEQGQVVVRVLPAVTDGGEMQIRVEVIDSGIGIPADRMDRLFQSFSQVDTSTTRRFGGTGLGLAISKQLVELMRGTIGVQSEAGHGSTFWFNVPLQNAERLEIGDESRPDALAEIRVLVVGENPALREILCRRLTTLGCLATSVSSAEAATLALDVASSQGSPYRIAIVDKRMQGAAIIDPPKSVSLLWLVPLGVETDITAKGSNAGAGFVTKPVRRRQLVGALLSALGAVDSAGQSAASEASVTIPANASRQRILLAEDNTVNQMIATELLSAAGYICEIVDNGRSAVDAVQRGGFDLILMDCQMPVLDGFEATRAIRDRERADAADGVAPRHIPIIALTANAGEADRQRCLAAGMDSYCGKPFNVDQLLVTVRSLLPTAPIAKGNGAICDPPSQAPAATAVEPQPAGPAIWKNDVIPFDLPALLRRCTGNDKLAIKLLDKFAMQSGDYVSGLQKSLREADYAAIGRTSHRLRGTAGTLSATALHAVATKVEELCRDANIDAVSGALDALHQEIQHCVAYVQTARARIEAGAIASIPEDATATRG
ncbi:MAG TPA: ATP-binding protein [Tepidisphaeraceae bacterium]|jgi:signal transduction histidine kinase/CheY-like chemotaxis protein|nr:ATP-binding protein [Tepidisphaeraceae bacterium]